MANYAIGDIQGCFEPFMRLLESIRFNEHNDRLWFVGDLVNRGPDSLKVLRFIKALALAPRIVLGNHDLYLLARLYSKQAWQAEDDTLQDIILAEDADELGQWLRQQPVFYHDPILQISLCHAGIPPIWDLTASQNHAKELETALQAPDFHHLLDAMYGNEPHRWSEDLTGYARLRLITNYFTRMRWCDSTGALLFDKQSDFNPQQTYPWFEVPNRQPIPGDILFGHWAALGGRCPVANIYALDTGCYWGNSLTALRIEDKKIFSVAGLD